MVGKKRQLGKIFKVQQWIRSLPSACLEGGFALFQLTGSICFQTAKIGIASCLLLIKRTPDTMASRHPSQFDFHISPPASASSPRSPPPWHVCPFLSNCRSEGITQQIVLSKVSAEMLNIVIIIMDDVVHPPTPSGHYLPLSSSKPEWPQVQGGQKLLAAAFSRNGDRSKWGGGFFEQEKNTVAMESSQVFGESGKSKKSTHTFWWDTQNAPRNRDQQF